MRRVIHLMPYDGIGGVEMAAATAEGVRHNEIVLERMFIFDEVRDRSGRSATFDPRALWSAAGRLARAQPALVILSLWRAVLVGWLARLRGCRAPMVLFLHNARDAHPLDRIVTRRAARSTVAVWADSRTTLEQRLPNRVNAPVRVISYLLDRPSPVRHADADPAPELIFWGRLAAQKDPLRMLAIFGRLHAFRPDARLTVIGPDGGLADVVRTQISKLGLDEAVRLTGPLPRAQIAHLAAKASFYLQSSRYEGMALSVMEAMQFGLVPVVTPVGEIARYTTDGRCAVWIDPDGGENSDIAAATRIADLLDAPENWRALRDAALRVSANMPLYSRDVVAAAAEVLARHESVDQ